MRPQSVIFDLIPNAFEPATPDGNGVLHVDVAVGWTGVREYHVTRDGKRTTYRALHRPDQFSSASFVATLRRLTQTRGHPSIVGPYGPGGAPARRNVMLDARGTGEIDADGFVRLPHRRFAVGQGGETIRYKELEHGLPVPYVRASVYDAATIDAMLAGLTHTSLGYRAVKDRTPGVFVAPDGSRHPYDVEHVVDLEDPRTSVEEIIRRGYARDRDEALLFRELLGANHNALALVLGRGGPGVEALLDSMSADAATIDGWIGEDAVAQPDMAAPLDGRRSNSPLEAVAIGTPRTSPAAGHTHAVPDLRMADPSQAQAAHEAGAVSGRTAPADDGHVHDYSLPLEDRSFSGETELAEGHRHALSGTIPDPARDGYGRTYSRLGRPPPVDSTGGPAANFTETLDGLREEDTMTQPTNSTNPTRPTRLARLAPAGLELPPTLRAASLDLDEQGMAVVEGVLEFLAEINARASEMQAALEEMAGMKERAEGAEARAEEADRARVDAETTRDEKTAELDSLRAEIEPLRRERSERLREFALSVVDGLDASAINATDSAGAFVMSDEAVREAAVAARHPRRKFSSDPQRREIEISVLFDGLVESPDRDSGETMSRMTAGAGERGAIPVRHRAPARVSATTSPERASLIDSLENADPTPRRGSPQAALNKMQYG